MDFVIEVDSFVILAIIGLLGAALIAGGIVLYRRGARASVRAFGSASAAAGTIMWAIVLISAPASSSTSGEGSPEGVPTFSGVCAEEVPDCNDTDVVTPDDDESDNGIPDGELHPELDPNLPRDGGEIDDGSTTQPPIRSDDGIDPDECNLVHNLTACSEDELDELDELKAAGIEPDVSGSASGETPTVEPSDVTGDGMVVPIGTFDQDGDSGPASGSETSEGAPVADGVMASSDTQ